MLDDAAKKNLNSWVIFKPINSPQEITWKYMFNRDITIQNIQCLLCKVHESFIVAFPHHRVRVTLG